MQVRLQEIKDRLGNIVKGKWEQNQSNVTVNCHINEALKEDKPND